MHIHTSERRYAIFTIVLLAVFGVAIAVSSAAYGIQVPEPEMRVDPRTVATPGVSPFGDPPEERVRELAPGKYEVYMVSQAWAFTPREIEIPVGSTVSFYATSIDVQHGFKLESTNLNFMILPGQVSKLTHTFNEPGEYNFYCHEYCGIAHHTMYGVVTVVEE